MKVFNLSPVYRTQHPGKGESTKMVIIYHLTSSKKLLNPWIMANESYESYSYEELKANKLVGTRMLACVA